MFLTSEAFRALDQAQLGGWDWRTTTVLGISYEWDLFRGGPEALAFRRLGTALLEAGASLRVLTAVGSNEQSETGNYAATLVPDTPIPDNKVLRALQMIRYGNPEPHYLWVRDAVRAGQEKLRTLPSDTIIYGRAMPGSSNIVAWHLSKLTGLPFVAHFSDEWPAVHIVSSGRKWLAPYKGPLFTAWRRRIIRDAGALTFTNPDQAAVFLGSAGRQHLDKSFVVTHLPSDPGRVRPPQQYDLFHIVHTGNFNPPGHSAAALIQGLRLFLDRRPAARGKVQFTQAGWNDGDVPDWTSRCDLGSVVNRVGRLGPTEVTALLDRASLLIGVDYSRSNSATLLSKLPDYIAAARPILTITAPSSAMGRLFREDGVGLTAHYDSPEEVADCIERTFDAWQARRPEPLLPSPAAIESFGRERALAELAAAFHVARRGRQAGREQSGVGVKLMREEATQ